jgi:hypothetical protein
MLESMFDLKFYLPRIEIYRERVNALVGSEFDGLLIAGSAAGWVGGGIRFCPVENLSIFRHDIHFGRSQTIVYADVHNTTVRQFILSLIENATAFILRPIPPTGLGSTRLRGYGIELREFPDAPDFEANIEYFDTPPPTVTPISWFPDGFPEQRSEYMGDLDVRLSAFLDQHRDTPLPLVLRDMTNNWPLFTRILSRTELPVTPDESLTKLRASAPKLSINGRVLPLQRLDPFFFFQSFLDEFHLRKLFREFLNVTSDAIFRAPVSAEITCLLDFRSRYVVWLNDIEHDPDYSDWSGSIADLFATKQPLLKIRKNLVNMVFYIDPMVPESLISLLHAELLHRNGVAMRIGLVPYFGLGSAVGRRVAFAFHHLAINSEHDAVKWLSNVLVKTIRKDAPLTVPREAVFAEEYSKMPGARVKWADLHLLFIPSSAEATRIRETHEYLEACGVTLGAVMVNGKPIVEAGGVQGLLYQLEIARLEVARLIAENRIRDLASFETMDLIAQHHLVLPSLDREFFTQGMLGVGLTKMTFAEQKNFVKVFGEVEWTHIDSPDARAFWL